MLTRKLNWQSGLSSWLVSISHVRFDYGLLDCGLFIAGAIEAMTDVDVAADLRGRYATRREAFALIRSIAGKPTMQAIAEHYAAQYELDEVGIYRAQRGDPVMLRTGPRSSLGIVAMHGTEILTPYRDGILRLPLSHATRAWHI